MSVCASIAMDQTCALLHECLCSCFFFHFARLGCDYRRKNVIIFVNKHSNIRTEYNLPEHTAHSHKNKVEKNEVDHKVCVLA